MNKLNLGLMYNKIFRRTIFLRPLPDKTFEAIDITGQTEQYLKDKTGATAIDPTCIVNVRGIKRVDKIAIKLYGSPIMANMFDGRNIKVQPPSLKVKTPDITVRYPDIKTKPPDILVYCHECNKETTASVPEVTVSVPETTVPSQEMEVSVPEVEVIIPQEQNMTEKTFGDMLNYAEIAGRMQAEHSPEADKKMNIILLLAAAAVLVGVFIFFKMKAAGV